MAQSCVNAGFSLIPGPGPPRVPRPRPPTATRDRDPRPRPATATRDSSDPLYGAPSAGAPDSAPSMRSKIRSILPVLEWMSTAGMTELS